MSYFSFYTKKDGVFSYRMFAFQCFKKIVILNRYLRKKEEAPDKKEGCPRMRLRRGGAQTHNPKCGPRDNICGLTWTGRGSVGGTCPHLQAQRRRGLRQGPQGRLRWTPSSGGRGCVLKTNLVIEELGNRRFRNKVQLHGLPSPSKKLSGCSLPLILPVSGSLHIWTSLAFASWSVSKG